MSEIGCNNFIFADALSTFSANSVFVVVCNGASVTVGSETSVFSSLASSCVFSVASTVASGVSVVAGVSVTVGTAVISAFSSGAEGCSSAGS